MENIREHNFSAGAQLPAIKELCKTLKISRSTLLKALDILESCNFITRRHGLGVFVNNISSAPLAPSASLPAGENSKRISAIRTVGVLLPSTQSFKTSNFDNYGLEVFEGIERQLRQHDLGCLLRLIDIYDFKKDVESLRKQPIDGFIVAYNIPDEVINALMEFNVPIVCAGRECHIRGVGSVSIDILNGYIHLLRLLETENYKHIGFALNENFAYAEDFNSLRNLYNVMNAKLELVCYDRLSRLKHEISIKKLINKLITEDKLPEVFICDSDWTALRILHELTVHGIPVPEQVKIIGFIGMNIANQSSPGITSMEFEHGEIGTRSVDMLCRLSGRKSLTSSEKIPVNYVERETFKFLTNNQEE